MVKTNLLEGNELRKRFRQLSQPLTENREFSFDDLDDDDIIDLEELISELENEITLDEILEHMMDTEDEDSYRDLNEKKVSKLSDGWREGRNLVMKLRSGLFKKLNDEELDDFMDVISTSFDMIRR